MFEDRGGLRLSTTSKRAAEHYRLGVDAFLSASAGVEDAFESALAADPDFALGHAARARALQARGAVPAAKEAIGRARGLAAAVTPRERRHIEALSLAIDGDLTGGLALVREHLADTPRDALGFMRQFGMSYPVVSDATGAVYINYGVVGMPETYVVGREGTIQQKIVGPVDPMQLVTTLQELVK